MSHCTHWTHSGEQCCDCGQVFPHDGLEQYATPCPPIKHATVVITLDLQPIADAFTAFKAALLEWAESVNRILAQIDVDAAMRQYAVERMGIAESDIKRVEFTQSGPVIVLKNWRRVPV